MPVIVVYTTGSCPYCVMARRLLQRKGVSFDEIRIDLQPHLRDEMEERSRRYTVPQIFIDEHHVGGFDDMQKADRAGTLDQLLGLDSDD